MDINASIIDQQLTGILAGQPAWLPDGDEAQKRSTAFVLLCMEHWLDVPRQEARELLTDGSGDAGVDGLHIGDVDDGEFFVTLFQGKYKKKLDGKAQFPENDVRQAVGIAQVLFDPSRKITLNEKIRPKIEEIRSMISDGYIPMVRFVLCNNGKRWNSSAQKWIDDLRKETHGKVEFAHFNHDAIIGILQKAKAIDATLHLNGEIVVEDMNHLRVLIGRISVQGIAELFEQHGDRLLQRNVRRYLGLHSSRVNTAIRDTLISKEEAGDFYFYNNGITVVCDKFDYNALQKSDYKVSLKNMQIVNGGQTCKTIHKTLSETLFSSADAQDAYVMIRIYQLSDERKEFVRRITYATNSQNPVDLRDLRSNDEIQKNLEIGMRELGYTYKRQREEGNGGANVVTSLTVAEAVLAIWGQKPHQAKFRRGELFGKLYEEIFQGLNAAQAVLAVLIFRYVENERKRPSIPSIKKSPPEFLPYSSHYIAMLVGMFLLDGQKIAQGKISHRNFAELAEAFQEQQDLYYEMAIVAIEEAIDKLYNGGEVPLQQLSATFRRGDLLSYVFGDR